jgi:lipopolysaccharide/colanic/teichoic acid biosynthesis glycosyltransferase
MAVVALAILVTCGRPIFYRSERLGRDGQLFSMWKFRTMKPDADQILENWKRASSSNWKEYSRNFKVKHDPRVTPIGRFLRRSSLDEIPQIWNVLRGDMSLVGPRPYFRHELAPFPSVQQAILLSRPGMAGPWQMAGRNKIGPALRMQIDLEYIATESLRQDALYLLGVFKIVKDFNGL